jgi:DKNYY family
MRQFIILLICSIFLIGCTNTNKNHYEVRHDGVYYFYAIEEGSYYKIEDADKNSFKDLGCGYGKDKNQVYRFQKSLETIEGVDPSTFELIDCSYSKDTNNVYYGTDRLQNSDPDSFEILNGIYSKDKNHVYFLKNLIEDADPATIACLNKSDYSYMVYYAKDANNVYFNDQTLENSDPNSFTVISPHYGYAKDDKNVYEEEELLYWIDAPSFELLGHYYYSKDKDHVYFFNGIVEGADPEEFEIIDVDLSFHGEIDGKDENNLYFRGKKIDQVDNSSYEALKYDNYVRDKNAIYYLRKNDNNEVTKVDFLEENDGVFEFVDGYPIYSWSGNSHFLKTDKAIYLEGAPLKGVDADSFVSLNDFYSKDKNGVYTWFELTSSNEITYISLEGVDQASFEVMEMPHRFDYEVYGKDKSNIYYKGEKITLDNMDFETLKVVKETAYMKDKNNVYCRDDVSGNWNVLFGADPITFEPNAEETGYSGDKNGYYIFCHKLDALPDVGHRMLQY